ncbi:LTA synthase family protein [Halomonas sp. C05BenzN]|uniref:LTA synthase family protein n=1 Tax=Halomonas sp. C05BenzN TaxID=3411041 RepID=UPI003B960940
MTQRTYSRSRPLPSLFTTWLKFFLILALLTWLLRLLGSSLMVPDALWPRAWWWGLRFDLAISALLAGMTMLGLWLPSRLRLTPPRRGWLVPACVILLGAHLGDWLYWQETGRHLGYEATELFNSPHSLLNTLYRHWPWLIGLLAVTTLSSTVAWVPSRHPGRGPRLEMNLLAVTVLTVLIVRGGMGGVPQGPHDAMRLTDAREATAALNGAYAALHGLQGGRDGLRRHPLDWMTAEEAEDQVATLYARSRRPPAAPSLEPVNVIVVLLESWSSVHMAPLEDGTPVTPHFDAIAARSLATLDMVPGGMRTTEGMFSLFCSYQNPLGQTLARTSQALFDFDCLPRRLRDAGWSTAFFQGSHENTSGVGAYAQSLGFEISQGKASIRHRDFPENAWGVYDHDLYRHVLTTLDDLQEPVLLGINTNTTHDTRLPDGIIPLVDASTPLDVERNVLHLADHELGAFIDALEARDWQHPWLLVLASDHTARVGGSQLERFRVPFALHAPGRVAPGTPGRIPHHRDVAPTLAELLGSPMPHAMGHSLLDPDGPQIAEYYLNGTLGWFTGDDLLVEFSLASPESATCHPWRQDPGLDRPQPCNDGHLDEIRRAYGLTQRAQARLFGNEALALVPPPVVAE